MNMQNQAKQEQTIDAAALLWDFAHQRPGLDFSDYGDRQSYQQDQREILKDLHSFRELYNLASRRLGNDFNRVLTEELTTTGDRLTMKGDRLEYITGQYWPTEYRSAACRVLSRLIWRDYTKEKCQDGTPVHKDGHEIRKAIKSSLKTRNTELYFE